MNAIFGLAFLVLLSCTTADNCYKGVNLAGLDFGGNSLPGQYGKDYISPTNAEIDYYMGKGMNMFRLPFLWERVQPKQNGPFDATNLGYVTALVNYATSKGAYILLDPHNYARYFGTVIGTGTLPSSSFANFWGQLAKLFVSNDHVIFGLMNEPNTMSTELWLSDANAAIAAIRSVGAKNLIMVPGNAWTGAHSWSENWYGTPNSLVMKGVVDPGNNYAIEVHQYLDSDNSGTHEACVSATYGADSLANFTAWAKENKVKAFVGEFAGARNDLCYSAVDNMLAYMDANSDVYVGFTWWSGGPWWGDYLFNLDPDNGADRPQMQWVQKHLCKKN